MTNHERMPVAPSVSGRSVSVGRFSIDLWPCLAYEAAYTTAVPTIGFAFDPQSGRHSFASDRRREFLSKPNSLAYLPLGCDVYSSSDVGGEYLTIAVGAGACDDAMTSQRFNDALDADSNLAARTMRRLILQPGPSDLMAVEAHVLTLLGSVERILHGPRPPAAVRGWLAPNRMKRIEQFIHAHLEQQISIQMLADLFAVSGGFFSRAFKAQTGQSPHDYITDRRVSRARQLFTINPHGLSDIALQCGFCSHAHMSAVFQQKLGLSPSTLRQCKRIGYAPRTR